MATSIRVTVVFAPAARQIRQVTLELPAGSRADSAVQRSDFLEGLRPEEVAALELGIWGRKVAADQVLRDGDRVELYRELKVDPKVARRERFARQGARGAGLFAKRRAGAKSGY